MSGKFDLQLHQVWYLILSMSELRMSIGTFLTGKNNQLVDISECRNQVSIKSLMFGWDPDLNFVHSHI